MSFVYMNKDLKFLRLSSSQTHTGTKLHAEWVEKYRAETFRSENFKAELKMRDRNYHSDISSAIIATFKVEVKRTVTILKQQNLESQNDI